MNKNPTETLEVKKCSCGGTKNQVITLVDDKGIELASPVRVGWYCSSCKDFERAILRERVVSRG